MLFFVWIQLALAVKKKKRPEDTYTGDYGRFAGYFFVCLPESLRGLFFVLFEERKKVSFIKHHTLAFFVRLIHETWGSAASSKKKSWYITLRLAYAKCWNQFLSRRFEYSMIWTWVSERRLRKIDRSAPNKKRICRVVKARVYVVWIYFFFLNSIETPASACTITFRKLCLLTSLILVYNVSLDGLSQRLLLLHVIWFWE